MCFFRSFVRSFLCLSQPFFVVSLPLACFCGPFLLPAFLTLSFPVEVLSDPSRQNTWLIPRTCQFIDLSSFEIWPKTPELSRAS